MSALLVACSPAEDEETGQNSAPEEVVEPSEEDALAPTIDRLFELQEEDLPRPDLARPDLGRQNLARQETVTTETLPEVRQVIPGASITQPQAGETVERLPTPPVPVVPPRPVNLGIVVVEAANRLETQRGAVLLEGTRAVREDASCQLDDGRSPACHILARTAVRRYVGTRTVRCVLGVREDTAQDHVAPCTLGDADLALWVVAQGWAFADAQAGATLLAAQTQARENGRGLWDILPESHLPARSDN